MVKVAYENGRVEDVDSEDLKKLLYMESYEDATFVEEYRGFKLTAILFGTNYPGICSNYTGYIEPLDGDQNMLEKLETEEVERESHFGWTGGHGIGPGFDCAHYKDIRCSIYPFRKKNELGILGRLFAKLGFEWDEKGDFEYEFSNDKGEATFKSREWVFEKLRKVADKALE